MSDETMTEEIKTPNEVYEDINKIRNKVGNFNFIYWCPLKY